MYVLSDAEEIAQNFFNTNHYDGKCTVRPFLFTYG